MDLTVAVDCDDVLTNFLDILVDEYNKIHGTNHTVEDDIKDWNIDNTIFEHGLFESLNDPDIIFKMKLKDENIIKENQILRGFPHPSGANVNRLVQLEENKEEMINFLKKRTVS